MHEIATSFHFVSCTPSLTAGPDRPTTTQEQSRRLCHRRKGRVDPLLQATTKVLLIENLMDFGYRCDAYHQRQKRSHSYCRQQLEDTCRQEDCPVHW